MLFLRLVHYKRDRAVKMMATPDLRAVRTLRLTKRVADENTSARPDHHTFPFRPEQLPPPVTNCIIVSRTCATPNRFAICCLMRVKYTPYSGFAHYTENDAGEPLPTPNIMAETPATGKEHALQPALQAPAHDSGFANYSVPVLLSPRQRNVIADRNPRPSRRDVSPRLIRSPQLPLPIRHPGNESDMVVNFFRRGGTARLLEEDRGKRKTPSRKMKAAALLPRSPFPAGRRPLTAGN